MIAKLNVDKYIDEEKKLFLARQRSKNRFGFIDNNTVTQQEDQNQDIMVVDSADKNPHSHSLSFGIFRAVQLDPHVAVVPDAYWTLTLLYLLRVVPWTSNATLT
ncbi:hypothetical protein KQX54_001553 [Cotesia glomerata]|uniref:Uncharacterized protein n=1 Tax=Cotesia glomerata TaxID=32391 RepID=A0AAV7IKV7_COTGL|nr:hypothetical protein KQX54_001553 [Cotesia glomerata]